MAWKSKSSSGSNESDPPNKTESEIRDYFLYLLSRRDYSRRELQNKAFLKKLDTSIVSRVLDHLSANGWQDDSRFAEAYASHKVNILGWGPTKIYTGLLQKGIQAADAKKTVQSVFNTEKINLLMEYQIKKQNKRLKREIDPLKRRKKVVVYLLRKGYDLNDVNRNLNNLLLYLNE